MLGRLIKQSQEERRRQESKQSQEWSNYGMLLVGSEASNGLGSSSTLDFTFDNLIQYMEKKRF